MLEKDQLENWARKERYGVDCYLAVLDRRELVKQDRILD